MNAPVELIVTRWKSKLPSTLSWPVGAQEISAAMAEVPQFTELELDFSFYKKDDIPAIQSSSWMTLIEIRYAKRDHGFSTSQTSIDRGELERHWQISVNPVLREDRKMLHDRLLPELPRVAAWLSERQSWQTIGKSSLLVVWNKREDTLYVSTQGSIGPERI